MQGAKGEQIMENKSKLVEEKLKLIEKGLPEDPCKHCAFHDEDNAAVTIESIIKLRSSVFTILEFTISCRIFRKSIKIRARLFGFGTRLAGQNTRSTQSRSGLMN